MGFNYALEKRKFDEKWKKLEEWYRKLGVVSQVRHERGRDTRNVRVRLERVQLKPEVLQIRR